MATEPTITSTAALLVDKSNGVVYAKNASTLICPASIMKLMTAYVARQWVPDEDLSDTVTVISADLVGGSSAGLAAGDVLDYEDLFYGMLLPSGCDAATTIARTVGQRILDYEEGSGDPLARFVSEMGTQATALGLAGAVIEEAAGLDTDNRFSCWHIVSILREIVDDTTLVAIMDDLSHDISISDGPDPRTIHVTNTINPTGDVKFPEYICGKTGSIGGMEHVSMLWNGPDDGVCVGVVLDNETSEGRFTELRDLMDYYIDLVDPPPAGILGNNVTTSTSGGLLSANTQYGSKYTLSEGPISVSEMWVYLDGGGSPGTQTMRATIYDDDGTGNYAGTLKGESGEVTITKGDAAAWVKFTLASPVQLDNGNWWLMIHCGNTGGVARIYRPDSGVGGYFVDTYSDGALATAAASSAVSRDYCIYAVFGADGGGAVHYYRQQ